MSVFLSCFGTPWSLPSNYSKLLQCHFPFCSIISIPSFSFKSKAVGSPTTNDYVMLKCTQTVSKLSYRKNGSQAPRNQQKTAMTKKFSVFFWSLACWSTFMVMDTNSSGLGFSKANNLSYLATEV